MPCPIRISRAALLLLASALLLHATTSGAQTTTATLQGVVQDASHALLPGVTVTLRDQNTGFVRTTTTD